MISEIFYRSELDNQYIKPLISCVAGYLTLQLIATFHSDVFFGFSFQFFAHASSHERICHVYNADNDDKYRTKTDQTNSKKKKT